MRKPEQVRQSVVEKLKKHGKGVVLLHDFQHATVEATMDLLNDLKAGGYKIVSMKPKYLVTTIVSYDEAILKHLKGPMPEHQPLLDTSGGACWGLNSLGRGRPGSLYAGRVSTAVWNGSRLSIASTLCVFTSHLNIRSTILSGAKSAMVKPCRSIGFTSSSMSRWAGGSAPVPRRADGQPLGRVLTGPVNTALIGLTEKSSLPLRIMRPMARACRSPLITSGTRSRTADIDSMRRSCCLSQPGCQ